jgi:RNA polymerase sigma-70 factor (ECF subfamily)
MMPSMAGGSPETDALLQRATAGDALAWGALLVEHEGRLERMVEFRLDPRVRRRIDASDVVQEAFLAAASQREDFFNRPPVPIFLWLRGIVGNKLLEIHRHHLGMQKRDAARDVPLEPNAPTDATSAALLDQLTGHATGPGTAAARSETRLRLRQVLDNMDATDREVLALRHFEQLTNGEAAAVLGLQERAAAKRYVRALKRLKDILAKLPGGLTDVRP